MKVYWDSSALILAIHNQDLLSRLGDQEDATRVHSLAELFCTLTKGVVYRYSAEDAIAVIEDLATKLTFVEIAAVEALAAMKTARRLGVRGARVHDLMHIAAATKFEAEVLLTLDASGFRDLNTKMRIEHPILGNFQ